MKFHVETACLLSLVQSSCSKPDLEAESAYMETMQDFSNPTWSRSLVSDTKMQKNEEYGKLGLKFLMHNKEAGGKTLVSIWHLVVCLFSSLEKNLIFANV